MKYDFLPFVQLIEDVSGGNIKLKGNEYLASGEIPIIDQGKEFISGYTNNLEAKFKGQLPVIVFGDHTRIFKYIDFSFAMGADGVKVLKLSEKLYSKFAFHYFNSCYIPDTGYNRHFKYLKAVEIPLPPLSEQKRIAEILDKADALRQKNKQLLAAYDELLQATFLDMFGDPVTNPKGWEKSKILYLINNIDSGWSPNCDSVPRKNSADWAILTLSAVSERNYKEFFNKNLPQELKPKDSIEVKKGDLLFSRKNTRELVGACAFVFETAPKLMMPDTIFRIQYKPEVLNGIYAFFLLNSINFRANIQRIATGSAGSMPNISKEKLKNLFVPLPPISLQNQFAQIVENIEAQKTLVKQSLQESEDLFNGLVQKAFGGEL